MLDISTIAVRQIICAYVQQDYLSKEEVNLVIILGFFHFVFWKKNLCTLCVLHDKEM